MTMLTRRLIDRLEAYTGEDLAYMRELAGATPVGFWKFLLAGPLLPDPRGRNGSHLSRTQAPPRLRPELLTHGDRGMTTATAQDAATLFESAKSTATAKADSHSSTASRAWCSNEEKPPSASSPSP